MLLGWPMHFAYVEPSLLNKPGHVRMPVVFSYEFSPPQDRRCTMRFASLPEGMRMLKSLQGIDSASSED